LSKNFEKKGMKGTKKEKISLPNSVVRVGFEFSKHVYNRSKEGEVLRRHGRARRDRGEDGGDGVSQRMRDYDRV
jgi:hypothetical protein